MKKPEPVQANLTELLNAKVEEAVWMEFHEPFDPMLAQKKPTTIELETKAVIAQPKLDGVRVIYDPRWKQLFTRNGLQIECCDHIVKAIADAGLANYALDGEIYVHGLAFDKINHLLTSPINTEETAQLQYHIFDWFNYRPMIERLHRMRSWSFKAPLFMVDTRMILTQKGIEKYYQHQLKKGYEGIMLRSPYADYKCNRTRALRRMKPVKDTEATLVGFSQGTGKNAKTFGSLLLRMPNGIEFKCAGFDDETRTRLHKTQPIGAVVQFTHQGYTINGVPRFPRFKGIRVDMAVKAKSLCKPLRLSFSLSQLLERKHQHATALHLLYKQLKAFNIIFIQYFNHPIIEHIKTVSYVLPLKIPILTHTTHPLRLTNSTIGTNEFTVD